MPVLSDGLRRIYGDTSVLVLHFFASAKILMTDTAISLWCVVLEINSTGFHPHFLSSLMSDESGTGAI